MCSGIYVAKALDLEQNFCGHGGVLNLQQIDADWEPWDWRILHHPTIYDHYTYIYIYIDHYDLFYTVEDFTMEDPLHNP